MIKPLFLPFNEKISLVKDVMMKLRLKDIRENLEMTQKDMAKILNISSSYYNYFETGERIITIYYLNKFCNIWNYSFDYILNLSNHNIVSKENYIIDKKLIGERIKLIRKEKKLSQEDLANIINTSQSTISAYESGKTLILTAFLYEMATRLNISADYIIGRSNVKKAILPELDS